MRESGSSKRHDAAARVTKKLLPGQPGTLRLVRTYGDSLLCVRYRLDAEACIRYTTVELVVDGAPVNKRSPPAVVGVTVGYDETALRAKVRAQGARWDPVGKLWRMPYPVAQRLGLLERIVER